MRVLEQLEPQGVFRFFEELCAIPHGSRNCQAVSDWCAAFARERGLECHQDQAGNVIIIQEATPGYEAAAPVILQGHLDMVCEKEPGCTKDMAVDGLDLVLEGDTVSAKGTTLGGDDGIAVAMALAILDSSEIAHPALEAVFTVDEEIGMEGAQGLDFSQLSARRMLNIDSEDEGIFTVSCAGGASANVSVGLTMAPNAAPCVKLTVSGLIGGHSGQEINKGRANANILLGRVLDALVQKLPVRLVLAAGGRKDNAIPNAAEAVLALAEADLPAAKQIVSACTADLRKEYAVADPGVTVTLEEADVCPQALTEEATLRVVRYLLLVPNGIAAMSMDIPGLVQTSCNLGIFHVADGVLTPPTDGTPTMAVPSELLPGCPHCGRPMTMNLRCDDKFAEDEGWHAAAERYENFLRTRDGQKLLFLELGVGYNTPVIIKYPFLRMTAGNPKATYACINMGQASTLREIEERSILIDGDIAAVIEEMKKTASYK